MSGIEVTWSDNNAADLFADCRGMLTTEHAASSYGQPVVVGDDGQAYGPGDFGSGRSGPWQFTGEGSRTSLDAEGVASMLEAARAAGWKSL